MTTSRPLTCEEFAEVTEEWRRKGCPTKKNPNGWSFVPIESQTAHRKRLHQARMERMEKELIVREGKNNAERTS